MDFDTIELRHVQMPLVTPFETSFIRTAVRNLVIIGGEVDGDWYYGEASSRIGPFYNHDTTRTDITILEDYLVPELRDADTIEEYTERVSKLRGYPMAKAAGEFLLYHRRSVEKGVPIAELLGGTHDRLAIGVSVGIEDDVDDLLAKVEEFMTYPFRRIKLKIEPGRDVEHIRAVRDAYPDVELMVDANSAYTLDDTDRLRELEGLDLTMIEQPLSENDIVNHGDLADRLAVPICLDESIHSLADVKRAAKIGACEVVNLKPQRLGGLTETARIDAFARETGLETWVGGHLESGIGQSFAIAAASLGSVAYPNDIGPSARYYTEDVMDPEITATDDGYIEIPDTPGLVGEVDRERLDAFTERRIEL